MKARRILLAVLVPAFLCIALLILSAPTRSLHDVSAADYGSLAFNGLIRSNGVEYGSYTFSNRHDTSVSFYVNNREVKTRRSWNYEASWSPGGARQHPTLGSLDNRVAPGATQTFLIPSPDRGDAWRIHLGVLRWTPERSLSGRLKSVIRTRSIASAFVHGNRYKAVGMLDGPEVLKTTTERTPVE